MKHKVAIICLAVLLLASQLIHPSRLMARQDSTLLTISPGHIDTKEGQSFTVSLQARDTSDLYGFQLDLVYTPGVLQVDKITFSQQQEFSELPNEIDNVRGMVSLAATLTGDRRGLDGTVDMVDIEFSVIGQGDAEIDLSNVKLSNSQAQAILFEITPFSINNDNSPPSLKALRSIDNNTVEIIFDEPINYEENLDPDNFSIECSKPEFNGCLEIEDIQFGSSHSIILTTASQTGARLYQLKVENIRDGLYNTQSNPQMADFIGHPRIEIRIENQPYSNNKFYVSVNLGDLDNFKQVMFIIPFDKEKTWFYERCDINDPMHENIAYPVLGTISNNAGRENDHREVRYNARLDNGIPPLDLADATVARFLFEAKEPQQDLEMDFKDIILICADPGGGDIVFSSDPDPQQNDILINPAVSSFSILKGHALTASVDCYGGSPSLTLRWLGNPDFRCDVSGEGTEIEVADLIPGDYQLSITNHGYLAHDQQISITDNQHLEVWLAAGDVDSNGTIDIFDLIQIAQSLNASKGQEKYFASLDFNSDLIIDIYDVVIAAKNFGLGVGIR